METRDIRFDKEIVVSAKLDELDRLLEWISDILEADCPSKTINQIAVVTEELFVNIASYAYGEKTGDVTIRISFGNARFVMQFEDSGLAFNPLEHELPDVKAGIDDRKIGGLGIYLTRKWMDEVNYQRENGKNILTIIKRL
jgi:sigma-B regulation protein RsbU (phosphoserine phosphatase)